MSRQIGRIVTDLPVELDLETARTGRYDRRAVAQRFRELEFRSLIDRLPPSSIAPTGYGAARARTKGGLQLSLDLLGGAERLRRTPSRCTPRRPRRAGPADRSGRRHRARGPADRAQRRGPGRARGVARRPMATAVGLGWAVGPGRPLERPPAGHRAGGRGRLQLVSCPATRRDGRRAAAGLVRRATTGADRARPEAAGRHCWRAGAWASTAPAFDTLVASYMLNPALRAQTLDDLAANRFGAELPARAAHRRDRGGGDASMARRAAGEALTALLVAPALEAELREAALGDLFDEVEMPLLPVLARMELAGVTHRPRRAGGHERRVRRAARRARGADLRAGRPRVQHRLTQAARADPLRRARAARHEADADRLLDGRIGPGGAARQARGGRPDPRAPADRRS